MRRLILLLAVITVLLFPFAAYADSGGAQGTLIGWSFHPPLVPGTDPGFAFSYLSSDGLPGVVLVPLVPAFGVGHWDDPQWTKEDALAPLQEYIVRYGQNSLRDLFGGNGDVTFSPEVFYAMKAQGFDPSTFGGPTLDQVKIVSTKYDTEKARGEIQSAWPASFTVQDVGGPIVGQDWGEGGPGVAGKPGLPDPNAKLKAEKPGPAPLTPELAGISNASYEAKTQIHPPPVQPAPVERYWPFGSRGWSKPVKFSVISILALLLLIYIYKNFLEYRIRIWKIRRRIRKNGVKFMSLIFVFVLASGMLPHPARAADQPTFDSNMQRTRTITDSGYNSNGNLMYSSTPVYIPIQGVKSYTNPVVAGNVMYQYCYDDQGYGYLYAFDASQKPPTDQYGNPTQQIWNAPQVWSGPIKFNAGFDTYGGQQLNNAAGVAGPSVANGYVAVGCGTYLYVWPEGGVPDSTGKVPGEVWYHIFPNRYKQSNQQVPDEVSSSPVITPPIDGVPWIAVGSWSGGFTCAPAQLPPGISDPDQAAFHYYTANLTSDSQAIITSSPAWDSFSGTILFGVDANYPNDVPRMVSMDPTTGQYTEFGNSHILYGISSSPAVAGNGHIYVPDKFGGIYKFSALPPFDFGAENLDYVPPNPSSGSLDISNICVDETDGDVWAVENHYTELAILDIDTLNEIALIPSSKAGIDLGAVSSVESNSGMNGFFNSYYGGYGVIHTDVQFNRGTGSLSFGTISSLLPPFSSVVPDFGPNQWIAAWTNKNNVNGEPSIQLFVPCSYQLKAFFTQDTTTYTPVTQVLPNSSVTLVANPLPGGITQSADADFPSNWGLPGNQAGLKETASSPETWTVNLTAPSQPGTYTVTVNGYSDPNYQNKLGIATTTLTVVDTIHNGNVTEEGNCKYLHVVSYGMGPQYAPPYDPTTGNWPPPNTLDPRPCPDFSGNTYGYGNMQDGTVQTKLADTVACRFVVPVNDLKAQIGTTPKGDFLGGVWGQWYVYWTKYGPTLRMVSGTDKVTLQHPRGQLSQGPDYTTLIDYPTDEMTKQGGGNYLVATYWFKENWAGFKPQGPYVRQDSFGNWLTDPANGRKTQYLQYPINGYSVSAHAWVSLIWEYQPPKAQYPTYSIYSFDLYDTVPLTITGTDVWIVPTTGGSDLFGW